MTGEQLRILREANGLSPRQFARLLGFSDEFGRAPPRDVGDGVLRNPNPAKQVTALESKSFVPEPLVILINRLIRDGKLVTRAGQPIRKVVRNGGY